MIQRKYQALFDLLKHQQYLKMLSAAILQFLLIFYGLSHIYYAFTKSKIRQKVKLDEK